jgi:hypothetical protein
MNPHNYKARAYDWAVYNLSSEPNTVYSSTWHSPILRGVPGYDDAIRAASAALPTGEHMLLVRSQAGTVRMARVTVGNVNVEDVRCL